MHSSHDKPDAIDVTQQVMNFVASNRAWLDQLAVLVTRDGREWYGQWCDALLLAVSMEIADQAEASGEDLLSVMIDPANIMWDVVWSWAESCRDKADAEIEQSKRRWLL